MALIRSLPKAIRRGLIPAPDVARSVATDLEFGRGDFFREVSKLLEKVADEKIPNDAFDLTKIPTHLQMNVRVVDADGELVSQSRDVGELRAEFEVAANTEIEQSSLDPETAEWHRDEVVEWDFGDLPKEIMIVRNGIELPVYPAVVDAGETAALRLINSAELARRMSRAGVRRLYAIQQRKTIRSQISWLPEFEEVCVMAGPVISRDELTRQAGDLIVDLAFFQRGEKLPRKAEKFEARLENAAERVGMATQDVAKLLPRMFKSYHAARLAIEKFKASKWAYATADVKSQIGNLFGENFLTETPWLYLGRFPKYFDAIAYRMEKLAAGALERDKGFTHDIAADWQKYVERAEADSLDQTFNIELVNFRWQLEEYRISCFAQPIGTMFSISQQRLDKQWAKVEK